MYVYIYIITTICPCIQYPKKIEAVLALYQNNGIYGEVKAYFHGFLT
jgi:hypothetical protein